MDEVKAAMERENSAANYPSSRRSSEDGDQTKELGHNHYQVVTTTIMGASCPASSGPGCPPSATGHRRRIMWNTNSLQLSDISIQTGVLCTLSEPDL